MKKLHSLCIIFVLLSIFTLDPLNVEASAKSETYADGSYITTEVTSLGNAQNLTRGSVLQAGECSITKAGRGRIYVYASTTAVNQDVNFISVSVFVDRYNDATGSWEVINRWQKRDSNTYFVSTSKSFAVDRGYYYRVRATHIAGTDYPYSSSTSFTDGIFIN